MKEILEGAGHEWCDKDFSATLREMVHVAGALVQEKTSFRYSDAFLMVQQRTVPVNADNTVASTNAKKSSQQKPPNDDDDDEDDKPHTAKNLADQFAEVGEVEGKGEKGSSYEQEYDYLKQLQESTKGDGTMPKEVEMKPAAAANPAPKKRDGSRLWILNDAAEGFQPSGEYGIFTQERSLLLKN